MPMKKTPRSFETGGGKGRFRSDFFCNHERLFRSAVYKQTEKKTFAIIYSLVLGISKKQSSSVVVVLSGTGSRVSFRSRTAESSLATRLRTRVCVFVEAEIFIVISVSSHAAGFAESFFEFLSKHVGRPFETSLSEFEQISPGDSNKGVVSGRQKGAEGEQ